MNCNNFEILNNDYEKCDTRLAKDMAVAVDWLLLQLII